MKQFEYTIQEAVGIHARPAGLLVKECKKYQSTITIARHIARTFDNLDFFFILRISSFSF